MVKQVITLLTDFGYGDYYVAAMKAVILSISPNARIVDMSHCVPRWNTRVASYILGCCYKYFPQGTIHVVVVDPGVGTERRGIVVFSRRYVFVGPDNGVLIPPAKEDGIREVRVIENRNYMLEEVSYTFHGRDVFAPVAAHISRGIRASSIGRQITDYIEPGYSEPKLEDGLIIGEVLNIDNFGNVATNVSRSLLLGLGLGYGSRFEVEMNGRVEMLRLLPSFAYTEQGRALLLINSCEKLELAVNMGSAASLFDAKVGDEVILRPI